MIANNITLIIAIISLIGVLVQAWYMRYRTPVQQAGDVLDNRDKTLKTLSTAFDEIDELRELYRKSERMQRVQWVYIINLLETLKYNNVAPPLPPDELKTDPEIIRLTQKLK